MVLEGKEHLTNVVLGASNRSLSSESQGGSAKELQRAPTMVKRNRVSMLGFTPDDIDLLWNHFRGMVEITSNFSTPTSGRETSAASRGEENLEHPAANNRRGSMGSSEDSVLNNNRSARAATRDQIADMKLDITSSLFLVTQKLEPSITANRVSEFSDLQLRNLMRRVSNEQRKVRISNGRGSDKDRDMLCFEDFCIVAQKIKIGEVVPPKREWLPIAPDTMHKQCWDLLVMVFLIFTCFAVPYQLAFDMVPGHIMTPFNQFDLFVDILFMTDVMINFVTAYDHEGLYVKELSGIAVHYLRTWFFLDLAGSFPIDKILTALPSDISDTSDDDGFDLASLRILKAVRMLKLIRTLKLMEVLNRMQEKEGFATMKKFLQIFKSIFVMLYSAHLIGCIFTMLIDEERYGGGVSWLAAYDPELPSQDNWQRYIAALYWATVTVSTIGYGDIIPVTHIEREYACVMNIFGACVFAYGMGNITSLISGTFGSSVRFDSILASMAEWMDYRKVPKDVQGLVKRHLYSCFRRSNSLYEEKKILATMPPELTRTLLSHFQLPSDWKQEGDMPILEGLPPELQGALLSEATMLQFLPHEVIYRVMDVGTSIYILLGGQVEVVRYNNLQPDKLTAIDHHECKTITDTGIFGESSMFEDICKYRAETVIANTAVKVLCIGRYSALMLGRTWPFFLEKLRRLCKLRASYDCVNTRVLEDHQAQQREDSGFQECYLDRETKRLIEVMMERRMNEIPNKGELKAPHKFMAWEVIHQNEVDFLNRLRPGERQAYKSNQPQPVLPAQTPSRNSNGTPMTPLSLESLPLMNQRWERAWYAIGWRGKVVSMRECEKALEYGQTDVLGHIDAATSITRARRGPKPILGAASMVTISLADSTDNSSGNALVEVCLAFASQKEMEIVIREVKAASKASLERKARAAQKDSDTLAIPMSANGSLGNATPRVTPRVFPNSTQQYNVRLPAFIRDSLALLQRTQADDPQLWSLGEDNPDVTLKPGNPLLPSETSNTQMSSGLVESLAADTASMRRELRGVEQDVRRLTSTVDLIANVHASKGFF